MLELLFIPLLLVYFCVLTALFVYGINFYWLTWKAVRSESAQPAAVVPSAWPRVAVQLPIYNELYVARRLLDAVARFDYPASKLEIQVLDDSTDETSQVVQQAAEHWREQGVNVTVVRRENRDDYKAGALANGLALTDAEYVALFDADFVPNPDFLQRTLPVLNADPGLAFVQTRWGHTNRGYSVLTFLQSLAIDGHFAIEQQARWRAGYCFNFNGTAGVWRREALEDAGGWQGDTLTEDLDISYRAFLRGWRAAYLRDVESPSELPVSFDAYRRQQHRWARGSFECAVKHIPSIWRSSLPWWHKLQATLHLTGYGIHLLMLALVFMYPLVLLVSTRYPVLLSLFGFMTAFNAAGLAPTLLFAAGQQQLGRRWWSTLPVILLLTVLGSGMMVTTARAALQAMSQRSGTFERTPKFGISKQRRDWMGLKYRIPLDKIVLVELALASFCLATTVAAMREHAWAVAFYTALFGLGLGLTAGCTILQSLRSLIRARSSAADAVPAIGATSTAGGG